MNSKAGMKFDCIFEEPLDFIDIDYTHLNKTVRYENRLHGEWIEKPSYKEDKELGIDKQVVCSRCDEQNSNYVYGKDGRIEGKMFIRSNFCPNCGADMRKEGDENG